MRKRVIDGRFELVERLGGGGMGLVWRAWDVALHRDVALKEVRPPDPSMEEHDPTHARELRSRVLREARALARLNHPNVATIHHIVDPDEQGYPWIVMELVTGGSLQDRIQRGPMPVPEAARLGREVLAGLRAAHAVGIQHRDVKPANVLLREDGRAVLTDFGIAAMRESTSLTATGAFIGSPEYMAPERINGVEGDPASDFWSLGMMVYVAVEGRHPLRRNSTLATLAAVLNQDVPPAERAGVLGPVLGALLVRDPAARPDPETLDRMLAAAEAGHLPPLPRPAPPLPGPPPQAPPASGPPDQAPHASGPHASGPHASGPHASGPHAFGPHAPGPHAPGPYVSGPVGPVGHTVPPAPGNTVPPGYAGSAPPPWAGPPVPRADTANRRRAPRRGRAKGAVAAVSASVVVVVGVVVWQLIPAPRTTVNVPDPTSLTLRDLPTPTTNRTGEPARQTPTRKPAEENLLTPAGMRTMIAKLKPVIGGTKVVRMTIHPTHASVDVPRKDNKELYDSYDYRDGEVTGPRTGRTFKTPLVDLATFNWNALPALIRRADKDLGAPDPTSHHMIVDPDYVFTSTRQVLLVYASDDYGRGGYLVANPKGKVLKLVGD